jgi:hypothetical protein
MKVVLYAYPSCFLSYPDSEAAQIKRPTNPRNITSEDGNPVSVNVGNDVKAITNSKISINCPVSGTPKPVITWRKNGFELVESEGYSILENGTLVIEKAKVKDKGQYTCVAKNMAGKDSVATNIKVLSKYYPLYHHRFVIIMFTC